MSHSQVAPSRPDSPAPAAAEASTISPSLDYWQQSREPLTSLAFVAPLLVLYELGVVLLGRQAARNGVDVWLRRLLDLLGTGQYFLLPALTIGILLGWHYMARRPWRVHRGALVGMGAECLLLAVGLRIVLQLELAVWLFFRQSGGTITATGVIPHGSIGALGGAVALVGAGVYEELFFRLILLSAVVGFLTHRDVAPRDSRVIAVLATSLVFSAAHYVGASGEAVALGAWTFWFGAVFRFLAGVLFGVLFVFRGFGVAVGSHAAYNVLVKLL